MKDLVQATLTLSSALLTLATLAAAKTDCREYPNYESRQYTYIVCENAPGVENFNTSRQYCKENFKNSDLVVFANEEEFKFIQGNLNGTVGADFRYIPGFFQKGTDDTFNPQTGEFYWINDPDTRITVDSETYWKPFESLITKFGSQAIIIRQKANFMVDTEGVWYPASSLGSDIALAGLNGNVICMRDGVPVITPAPLSSTETMVIEIDYWIIIGVAAGVVFLGLILGLTIFCIHKKTTKKQEMKFHKVPQQDNQGPQHV